MLRMNEALACAAVAVALLALAIALAARSKARGLESGVAEAKAEAARRAANATEEAKAELEVLRRTVGRLVAGAKLSEEQVLEGRLWSEVESTDARRLMASGALRVVDVRTPRETAQGVIPGALLLPLDDFEQRFRELPSDARPTLVYCAGGGRSAAACEFLTRHGYREVLNLAGGIQSWSGPLETPAARS
jgi:rhodanese-related sulfurtransferase